MFSFFTKTKSTAPLANNKGKRASVAHLDSGNLVEEKEGSTRDVEPIASGGGKTTPKRQPAIAGELTNRSPVTRLGQMLGNFSLAKREGGDALDNAVSLLSEMKKRGLGEQKATEGEAGKSDEKLEKLDGDEKLEKLDPVLFPSSTLSTPTDCKMAVDEQCGNTVQLSGSQDSDTEGYISHSDDQGCTGLRYYYMDLYFVRLPADARLYFFDLCKLVSSVRKVARQVGKLAVGGIFSEIFSNASRYDPLMIIFIKKYRQLFLKFGVNEEALDDAISGDRPSISFPSGEDKPTSPLLFGNAAPINEKKLAKSLSDTFGGLWTTTPNKSSKKVSIEDSESARSAKYQADGFTTFITKTSKRNARKAYKALEDGYKCAIKRAKTALRAPTISPLNKKSIGEVKSKAAPSGDCKILLPESKRVPGISFADKVKSAAQKLSSGVDQIFQPSYKTLPLPTNGSNHIAEAINAQINSNRASEKTLRLVAAMASGAKLDYKRFVRQLIDNGHNPAGPEEIITRLGPGTPLAKIYSLYNGPIDWVSIRNECKQPNDVFRLASPEGRIQSFDIIPQESTENRDEVYLRSLTERIEQHVQSTVNIQKNIDNLKKANKGKGKNKSITYQIRKLRKLETKIAQLREEEKAVVSTVEETKEESPDDQPETKEETPSFGSFNNGYYLCVDGDTLARKRFGKEVMVELTKPTDYAFLNNHGFFKGLKVSGTLTFNHQECANLTGAGFSVNNTKIGVCQMVPLVKVIDSPYAVSTCGTFVIFKGDYVGTKAVVLNPFKQGFVEYLTKYGRLRMAIKDAMARMSTKQISNRDLLLAQSLAAYRTFWPQKAGDRADLARLIHSTWLTEQFQNESGLRLNDHERFCSASVEVEAAKQGLSKGAYKAKAFMAMKATDMLSFTVTKGSDAIVHAASRRNLGLTAANKINIRRARTLKPKAEKTKKHSVKGNPTVSPKRPVVECMRFTMPGPISVPYTDPKACSRAVEIRMLGHMPQCPKQVKSCIARARRFIDHLPKKNLSTITKAQVDEYYAHLRSTKGRRFAEKVWATRNETLDYKDARATIFVKNECYPGKRSADQLSDSMKNRMIWARSMRMLSKFGPLFHAITKHLKTLFSRNSAATFIPGLNASEIGLCAEECYADYAYRYHSDAKNWDGVFPLFANHLEKEVLTKVFGIKPDQSSEIAWLFKNWTAMIAATKDKSYRVKFEGGRRSGDLWTSIFNSLFNIIFIIWITRTKLASEEGGEPILKCWVNGDDNFYGCNSPIDIKDAMSRYLDIGIECEIVEPPTILDMEFCSGYFIRVAGHYRWSNLTFRGLMKLCYNIESRPKKQWSGLVQSKLRSFLDSNGHVPVVSSLVRRLIDYKIKAHKQTRYRWLAYEGSEYHPDSDSFLDFSQRYDVPVEEVIMLHHAIKDCEIPPGPFLIHDPVFMRCLRKDLNYSGPMQYPHMEDETQDDRYVDYLVKYGMAHFGFGHSLAVCFAEEVAKLYRRTNGQLTKRPIKEALLVASQYGFSEFLLSDGKAVHNPYLHELFTSVSGDDLMEGVFTHYGHNLTVDLLNGEDNQTSHEPGMLKFIREKLSSINVLGLVPCAKQRLKKKRGTVKTKTVVTTGKAKSGRVVKTTTITRKGKRGARMVGKYKLNTILNKVNRQLEVEKEMSIYNAHGKAFPDLAFANGQRVRSSTSDGPTHPLALAMQGSVTVSHPTLDDPNVYMQTMNFMPNLRGCMRYASTSGTPTLTNVFKNGSRTNYSTVQWNTYPALLTTCQCYKVVALSLNYAVITETKDDNPWTMAFIAPNNSAELKLAPTISNTEVETWFGTTPRFIGSYGRKYNMTVSDMSNAVYADSGGSPQTEENDYKIISYEQKEANTLRPAIQLRVSSKNKFIVNWALTMHIEVIPKTGYVFLLPTTTPSIDKKISDMVLNDIMASVKPKPFVASEVSNAGALGPKGGPTREGTYAKAARDLKESAQKAWSALDSNAKSSIFSAANQAVRWGASKFYPSRATPGNRIMAAFVMGGHGPNGVVTDLSHTVSQPDNPLQDRLVKTLSSLITSEEAGLLADAFAQKTSAEILTLLSQKDTVSDEGYAVGQPLVTAPIKVHGDAKAKYVAKASTHKQVRNSDLRRTHRSVHELKDNISRVVLTSSNHHPQNSSDSTWETGFEDRSSNH